MELVLDHRPASDSACSWPGTVEFTFAGWRRRVLAEGVNVASGTAPFLFVLSGAPIAEVLFFAALGTVLVSQVLLIVITGNTLGGWTAGCTPRDLQGRTIRAARFLAREWCIQFNFAAAGFLVSVATLPLKAVLRSAFGDVALVVGTLRLNNGLRVESLLDDAAFVLVIAWFVRDFVRNPRHQALHDRQLSTIVIRTRGIFG